MTDPRKDRSAFLRRFAANKPAVLALFVLLLIIAACISAPLIAEHSYWEVDITSRNQGISATHPLGTDTLGRDMLSRLLYGGRITLQIAFSALLMSAAAGTFIGILSGYCGGWVDNLLMRVLDAVSAVPTVLLAIAVECALGWGQGNYMYAIAISLLPSFAKVIRASVLNIRSSEYIEAAKALGLSNGRIIVQHVLRNISTPFLVQLSASAGEAFIMCTLIGYIGIGVNPPLPEWGAMAAQEYGAIRTYPLKGLLPSIAIFLCALSLNSLGNGLRDAFDTGHKRTYFNTEDS